MGGCLLINFYFEPAGSARGFVHCVLFLLFCVGLLCASVLPVSRGEGKECAATT